MNLPELPVGKCGVEIADNGLTPEGIKALCDALSAAGLTCPTRHEESWSWQWVEKRGGTLPKRLQKWLRAQHTAPDDRAKITPALMGKLGQIAAAHCEKRAQFILDTTSDFDWKAGDFGDAGSCFWGANKAARAMLTAAKARALRFYDPASPNLGIGRCWVLTQSNQFRLFNAYHKHGLTLLTFARVLATLLGLTYERRKATNNGDTTGLLWINSGACYIVGHHDAIATTPAEVDFGLQVVRNRQAQNCCSCDSALSPNYVFTDDNGDTYCGECYNSTYFTCDRCNGETLNEDAYSVSGESWCERCYERHAWTCGWCSESYTDADASFDVDGETWCEHCADRQAAWCQECERHTTRELDENDRCPDCHKETEPEPEPAVSATANEETRQ